MRFDYRYDLSTFTITLEPEEVNQDADILELPDDFRAKAAEFLEARRKEQEAEARERRLAAEAAAACPIKIGQEVRDPEAWRSQGTWWRVRSIGGTPERPWLYCDQVRADGTAGQKEQTFYGISGLEVRDNTEGKPREKQKPLAKLAEEITVAMKSAVSWPEDPRRSRHASVKGSRIKIVYSGRYGDDDTVSRAVAEDYLSALREGFVGTIYDLRDYLREKRAAAPAVDPEMATEES